MDSTQFAYWLQGYLEISGAKELNEKQLKIVQDHLKLVFTKITPSYGGYVQQQGIHGITSAPFSLQGISGTVTC